MERKFIVEGVDESDGGRTLLHEASSSSEALEWLRKYVRHHEAGGWKLIEVYDVCDYGDGDAESERIDFWEAPEAECFV